MSRKTAGIACMVLGTALIMASAALVLHNQRENTQAGEAVINLLPELQQAIPEQRKIAEPEFTIPSTEPTEPFVMTVTEIDGHGYIGYLSIPSLGLELPVMSEWSYPKLRIAPCRQFGTTRDNNLVIAGHNYQKHFGNLKILTNADGIFFTDMDGEVTCYQVECVNIISPDSTEEVENSPWDLILYTCTYGGKSRVMVGCQRQNPNDGGCLF